MDMEVMDRKAAGAAIPATRSKIQIAEIDKVIGFTPRIERLKQRFLATRPAVDGERAWFMLESFKQTEGEHKSIRRAKAFRNLYEKKSIAIRDDELLVGASTRFLRGAVVWAEGQPLQLSWILSQHEPPTTASPVTQASLEPLDKERLLAACDYWKDKYTAKRAEEILDQVDGGKWRLFGEARMGVCEAKTPMLFMPGADYDKLLAIGFNGYITQAQDHIERIKAEAGGGEFSADARESLAFLESVVIVLEGAITHAHRHARLAREMAAKEVDAQRKQELLEIAERCEWVPANPPRNLHDALQMITFVIVGHDLEKAQVDSYPGRFDQYLWPFYERDINEGRLTRQQAGELLGCMFMKWMQMEPFSFMGLVGNRSFQDVAPSNYFINVTLGGVTRSGRDAANELSCLVLQVAKQVKTHQPHISVRYHRNMAPEFLYKAIECNRDHGGGIPAWFNDRLGMEYLLDRGVQWEDARDWAVAGCVTTAYPKSFTSAGISVCWANHAKLLEFALNNGVDPYTGHKLGAETGDVTKFSSWEEVRDAYKQQVNAYYDYSVANIKAIEKAYFEDADYFPFISTFLQDCIAAGKDIVHGGSRYPQLEAFTFLDRAIQDTADSLMAIRRVVFEDKKATMAELLDAMKKDFVGYESLRNALLAAPKYGNDDEEADALTADLWDHSVAQAMSYRNGADQRFTMMRQGSAWSTWAGKVTGALPNGRKAGTCLADASVSPVQGCDVKGPTATMNSVTKLDNMYMEGPLLNMKFAPGMLKNKQGMMKFNVLLGTYFDKGGFHVQFNILDREMLIDARKHPENYRDLVVRVAGYSAYWVELPEAVQDEIISRTEQYL